MGGYGSTRWNLHDTKYTVDDCLNVTLKPIGTLKAGNSGVLTWTRNGEPVAQIGYRVRQDPLADRTQEKTVVLSYTTDGGNFEYPVFLTTTPLPWGGLRHWFLCPRCDTRVAKLYKPPYADYFACRHCYKLSYVSRNEPISWRAWDKVMLNSIMADQGMTKKKAKRLFRAGKW